MQKDMVKYLFDLFERLDPDFQKTFEVEYRKLTDQEQLRFLRLLTEDLDKVTVMLKNMKPEELSAAA